MKYLAALPFLFLTLAAYGQSTYSDSTHRWVNGVWYDMEKPGDGYGYYMEGGLNTFMPPKRGSFYVGYAHDFGILLGIRVQSNYQAGYYLTNTFFLQLNYRWRYSIVPNGENYVQRTLTFSINKEVSQRLPLYFGVYGGQHYLTADRVKDSRCNECLKRLSFRYQTFGAVVGYKATITSSRQGKFNANIWMGTGLNYYLGELGYANTSFYEGHRLGVPFFYGLTVNYEWAPRWYMKQQKALGRYTRSF